MKCKKVALITMLLVMCITDLSFAASIKDAKKVFKSGNWTVLRSIDAMTDATTCTGIYKEDYGIQLTQDELYVSVRGVIQSVTFRFGENPPKPDRLADTIEKEIGSVIISGIDFSELIQSNRLRLKVLTRFQGIADKDIDITGIQAAVENIKVGCPEQSAATSSQRKVVPENLCSDELVSRMKSNGLKDKQIKKICQK
jgi:hypothetical protein